MFRTFFRSLIVSRSQSKARPQVQRFRPQLEVLEGRLAPSSWGGGFTVNVVNTEVEHNRDIGAITNQGALATNGGKVTQTAVTIGANESLIFLGGHSW
jgi:hypothetical protein